ncbi:ATP synthase F1 subunit delta [Rhodopirellula sp. SWK7]|uniref:ATP synthase F1 subunit delta n=1 Tax=Rhodopirellula sp. SWK7 TaxID=595460 RepID=UPI0002BD7269|nr:ATP synthase F1 subunit delta [Rhodopirellula sp. SWK7]EMI42644.1 ATPase, F1 complex, OSCP/delta subunit [Rhodopirellula sp. SWK7]
MPLKIPGLKALQSKLFRRPPAEIPEVSESVSQPTALDVGAEQLGKTYARALLGATQAEGSTDQVIEQLNELCDDALANSEQLRAAFASPRIDAGEKCRVLERMLAGSAHPTLLKFLKVMAGRHRLAYVNAVRDAVVKLHDEATGRLLVEVRTAVPMTDDLRDNVTHQLNVHFGKEVRLKEIVDPSVIGGMVIRVGDTVFDSSVASRLDKVGRAAAAGFARRLIEQSDQFVGN